MTKGNKFAALAEQGLKETVQDADQTAPAPPPAPEPMRMLGGRVPDSIFREFQYAKLEAESSTGLRRVTTEDAVEAFVRLLRDEEIKARWMDLLTVVRQGRRG